MEKSQREINECRGTIVDIFDEQNMLLVEESQRGTATTSHHGSIPEIPENPENVHG